METNVFKARKKWLQKELRQALFFVKGQDDKEFVLALLCDLADIIQMAGTIHVMNRIVFYNMIERIIYRFMMDLNLASPESESNKLDYPVIKSVLEDFAKELKDDGKL